MLFLNFVTILSLSSAIYFLPTHGQTANMLGCVRKVVCNVEPYLTPCCSESFANGTWDQKGMLSCVKDVLYKETSTCINGGIPGEAGGGEVENLRYRKGKTRNERVWFRRREERSAVYGFGSSNPFASRRSRQRGRGRFGQSGAMQNEHCEFIKKNQPNAAEDCSPWSEAATRCVNEVPLVKLFCQGGNLMTGIGMGGGMGGMSGPGYFGGMGNSGFESGSQGPFGEMGNTGFGFGGRGKPKGKIPSQPPPDDGREYEESRK